MKKYYKDFPELMAQLEKLVKKQVKHYLTDWTEYDVPRLHRYNSSVDRIEKNLIFIVRECGTWLICADDVKDPKSTAHTIYNYYLPSGPDYPKKSPNKYYKIDLLTMSIIELKFDEKGNVITPQKKRRRAA